jgi:hypothetical protein
MNCLGSLNWTWSEEDSTARESGGAQLCTAAVLAVEAEQGTRLVGDEDGAGRTIGAGLHVSVRREGELDEGVHACEKHLAGTLQRTDARGGEVVVGI